MFKKALSYLTKKGQEMIIQTDDLTIPISRDVARCGYVSQRLQAYTRPALQHFWSYTLGSEISIDRAWRVYVKGHLLTKNGVKALEDHTIRHMQEFLSLLAIDSEVDAMIRESLNAGEWL